MFLHVVTSRRYIPADFAFAIFRGFRKHLFSTAFQFTSRVKFKGFAGESTILFDYPATCRWRCVVTKLVRLCGLHVYRFCQSILVLACSREVTFISTGSRSGVTLIWELKQRMVDESLVWRFSCPHLPVQRFDVVIATH